jgi:dipeptidyl-peptidase-3
MATALPPQPARLLAEVAGSAVLALDAPGFSKLPRDQRLLAWEVSQAARRGEPLAYDQGDRHNLAVARLLRGILSRPHASPLSLLGPIRAYARAVWLFHGLHDPRTGHKIQPAFTAADLRAAALAARAAGADLGFGAGEYGLRALEGVMFDPAVDGRRTARGSDLPASAVNLYDGVTLRDLAGFREQAARGSRLVKEGGAPRERPYLLPSVADALDAALSHSSPPQRALLEPLSLSLRRGSPDALRDAERAFVEVASPVDFFLGFVDVSADPRGRKGLFAGFVGLRDAERTAALQPLAAAAPELARLVPVPLSLARPPEAAALFLASASGSPLPEAITLPLSGGDRARSGSRSVFFAGAEAATSELRSKAVAALAEPDVAQDLARCLPEQRFAFVALRELVGRARPPPREASTREPLLDRGALVEARADLVASILGPLARVRELGLLPDARCQALWPQFVAMQLVTCVVGLAPDERIDGDRDRARALQLWWLMTKGALVERVERGQRSLLVPDAARLRSAEADLLGLLQQLEGRGDSARLAELFERHASRPNPQWLAQMQARLRAAGVPPRVVLVPPRIEPVMDGDKLVDARLAPIEDLDAAVLRDFQAL